MLTIVQKFILAAVLVLTSMIGILAFSQYVTQKIKTFDGINLDITKVRSDMLMLRRNEKDFLARNNLKYRDKFEKNFALLEQKVSSLDLAASEAGIDTGPVATLSTAFNSYKDNFLALVLEQQKIGLHSKDGLYGALRAAVHQAETEIKALGDQGLRADMLQLRRNEKDFMLRLNLKYLDKFNKNIGLFLQHLDQSIHAPESKNKIKGQMKLYQTQFAQLIKHSQIKGLNSKDGLLKVMRTTVHTTEELLDKLSAELDLVVEEEIGSLEAYLWITNVLLALIVLAVMGWLALGILRPMRTLAHTITEAAETNDLSLRVTIEADDEIGATGRAFNAMLEKFQGIIRDFQTSSETLASAATELSHSSDETGRHVESQLAQTTEIAAAINQMSATVQEISGNTHHAASTANSATDSVQQGNTVIDGASQSIGNLAQEIERAAEVIAEFQEHATGIGGVLDVIGGIAEQTNLLALNAAIEAARAGEQGRGFAVVADEVRTLASRTQESTEEINRMIGGLQKGARDAVSVMDSSQEIAKAGVNQSVEASNVFNVILEQVSNINERMTQIATATEEQSVTAEEINRSVTSISDSVSVTAAGARESTAASSELSRIANQMQELTGQFKV